MSKFIDWFEMNPYGFSEGQMNVLRKCREDDGPYSGTARFDSELADVLVEVEE